MVYNDSLNPILWDEDKSLKPEIKTKLLEIYNAFINRLKEKEIPIDVVDILLLGSNAAYNYSENSDIDLHIVTDFNDIPLNDTLTQLFYNHEKSSFNDEYDITIKGLPVEVYIEDINAGTMSNGIYSLLQDKWLKFPEYNPPEDIDYSKLYDFYKEKVSNVLMNNNLESIKALINEIKMLRKMSLIDGGEYSKGNLVFKELRNDGSIEALYNKVKELTSKELSLENKQLIESNLSNGRNKIISELKKYNNFIKYEENDNFITVIDGNNKYLIILTIDSNKSKETTNIKPILISNSEYKDKNIEFDKNNYAFTLDGKQISKAYVGVPRTSKDNYYNDSLNDCIFYSTDNKKLTFSEFINLIKIK